MKVRDNVLANRRVSYVLDSLEETKAGEVHVGDSNRLVFLLLLNYLHLSISNSGVERSLNLGEVGRFSSVFPKI
jgi:hypothetical protein